DRRRRGLTAVALLVAALLADVACCAAAAGTVSDAPAGGGVRHVALGRSVRERRIAAVEVRGVHPGPVTLVVGCIHGNEPAGIAVADVLARGPARPGADL